MDAETEEVLNEFSFLGSDTDDASHELRMQTDTTDWGKSTSLLLNLRSFFHLFFGKVLSFFFIRSVRTVLFHICYVHQNLRSNGGRREAAKLPPSLILPFSFSLLRSLYGVNINNSEKKAWHSGNIVLYLFFSLLASVFPCGFRLGFVY